MTLQAPIATEKDRSAIAWLVSRLRDWDAHGVAMTLARHPDQTVDVLAVQALIAAVTRLDQKTPAVLALDGDHTNRARIALSRPPVTPAPLTGHELGGDCGYPGCGISEAMHKGARIPADIGPHEWETPRDRPPADPAAITRIRPTFHRTEHHT
jgi:hypothetical protein